MPESEEVIEQPVTEESAPAPEAETPEAPEPEPASDPEPEPQPSPVPEPSRRESLRIQKLVSKLKQQGEPEYSPKGLDYSQALEADPETIQQLETDRNTVARQAYADGAAQAATLQFQTRLEIDAPKIESKYPVLDKNSADFSPAVADAINTMYLSTVGYDMQTQKVENANIRYSDYVESIMELVEATATTKVARSTENIARQAATTALRPDGGTTPQRMNLNQAPGAMSNDELKAIIAQSLPK